MLVRAGEVLAAGTSSAGAGFGFVARVALWVALWVTSFCAAVAPGPDAPDGEGGDDIGGNPGDEAGACRAPAVDCEGGGVDCCGVPLADSEGDCAAYPAVWSAFI